jgi:lycopene cyclase domain-containing protein
MSLYLWLNIATFGTIFLSFDKKVAFYKYFKSLAIAMFLTAIVFIPWDSLFTYEGVWGFNDFYILGPRLFKLPLEEWLFFITVPFSCTFIHYVLKAYFKNPFSTRFTSIFWLIFSILIVLIGVLYSDQYYTFSSFLIAGVAVFVINLYNPKFMTDFMLTYLIALIPFLIVNSILTGSFTEEPVVWYNDTHNFGIRLGTIPLEDTVYNLLLLLLSTFFTHYFYTRKKN